MPKTFVVSVYEVFGLFFVSCMPISIISGFCKNLGRMTISKQNKTKKKSQSQITGMWQLPTSPLLVVALLHDCLCLGERAVSECI